MAESGDDFLDHEAEESEDEQVPKKKSKMGKHLIVQDSESDSSEEEEAEDEAKIREEMGDFVVDDGEAEAEAEKQKDKSDSSSDEDDDVDDEDIDLIQENLGIRISR